MAQAMSNDDYKSAKSTISADYEAAKAGCASMNGNAKATCPKDAKAAAMSAKIFDNRQYSRTT